MTRTLVASTAFLLGTVAALAQPCNPSPTALCLSASRFEVKVTWTDFQNNTGDGQAIPLTADTGYFWFFTNTNVELVIKVLDARGVNGHFWVFYGALSNVQYEITVRDSQTGDVQTYDNSAGQFASTGDTLAFPPSASRAPVLSTQSRARALVGRPVDETGVAPAVWSSASACTPTPTALCLSAGRFRVEAAWTDFQGNKGVGQAVSLTSDTGYFWFFSNTNVEAVIKVLDARPINNHFWVFYGALSNVRYTLTVTDTVTGIVKTYSNPLNLFASVGDTQAFGTPTTLQLIDGAVVKGEIDAETALLYKVYAFFGDPSLPAAYTGTRPGEHDHGFLREVVDQWSTLSPATQQLLAAYLAPPTYAGSWFAGGSAARGTRPERTMAGWTQIPTARSIVWYRAADANAETAANNLAAEIENIWTKETNLMQRDPIPDAGVADNGGNGKLDIYVLPSFRDDPDNPQVDDAVGVTVPYPGDGPVPAYILIRASYASTIEGARDVLAHEFFHIIAFAYPYKIPSENYLWMNEATATWMEDYVYPTQINNLEQSFALDYLHDGYQRALDYPSDHGYSEYIFFFYLARAYTPALNSGIWSNVPVMESWQAIDAVIPGGLKERWPAFALDCWNKPAVDFFKQWDGLPYALLTGNAVPQVLQVRTDGSATLPSRSLEHLAMSYAYFSTDTDVIRRVEFQTQPLAQPSPYAKTQAWIKLADGTTRVEDWTSKDRVVFCRDKASEKITDVLVLYTNSNPDPTSDDIVWNEGKINYDSIGCGYHGTVNGTSHYENSAYTKDETIDATEATFVQASDSTSAFYAARYTIRYQATERTKDIFTGEWCTETIGPVTRTINCSVCDGGDLLITPTGPNAGYYSALVSAGIENVPVTNPCPRGTPPGAIAVQWWNTQYGQYKANSDGSLTGTFTGYAVPGDPTSERFTYTWSFIPDKPDNP